MLSPKSIKTTLELFGVKNLSITFDTGHSQLVARFGFRGQAHEKVISFTEIEQAFSNNPQNNQKSHVNGPSTSNTGSTG